MINIKNTKQLYTFSTTQMFDVYQIQYNNTITTYDIRTIQKHYKENETSTYRLLNIPG